MHLKADTRHRVTVTLNGRERAGYAEPRTLLSDFLRHELGATGTRVGCEHGVCGACTVLVDGRASRSCLMLAVQAQGRDLQTVEFLTRVSRPTETQVRDMLSGHLCRCTGYTGIVNAILEVAETRDHEVSGPTDKEQENNNV